MKQALILLIASLSLIGCSTKEKKIVVYKNFEGEYVMPKKEEKGIFYGPPDVPGAMDPRNQMSLDKLRARENGMDQASRRAGH